MNVLKLVGVLLDYPQDAVWQHREELSDAVMRADLSPKHRAALTQFLDQLLAMDPLDAQDRWLTTFDRGRTMSLLLFEHIHGESRDRGQAMVDLLAAYRKSGFELSTRELPDYLPLVLEYLSLQSTDDVLDWLHNIQHIIGLLAARAAGRQSPYAALLTLLVELTDDQYDFSALRQRVTQEWRDDTPEAIDLVWEEEAVRFGVEAVGCNSANANNTSAQKSANDEVPLRFSSAQQVSP